MQLLDRLHFTVKGKITPKRLCIFIMICIISKKKKKNHVWTGPLALLHVC